MTTTTTAEDRPQPAVSAAGAKPRALQAVRLRSWKMTLIQSLGRELHALHIQQQERAFMATTHGLTYASGRSNSAALH